MANYFTKDTEDAIVEYNNMDVNDFNRSILYSKRIKRPMEKLCEFIINTFKFPYLGTSIKDIKADVISHVIINMDKYDPDKGAAFGYFSTMVKFYLIQANTKEYKLYKQTDSIDHEDKDDENSITQTVEDTTTVEKDYIEHSQQLIETLVKYLEIHMDILFIKESEKRVAYAIMQILENYKNIEKFNKKALYLILREMTNENSVVITNVITKLKEFFTDISDVFYLHGEIPDEYIYQKNQFSDLF